MSKLHVIAAGTVRTLVAAASVLLLSACFVTDILPEKPKNKANTTPTPSETAPPLPQQPPSPALTSTRLARRIALDLAHRLPAPADAQLLSTAPEQLPRLIDSYLAQREASEALADLHSRMWHLDPHHLSDLNAFADADDPTLGSALTDRFRRLIVDESSLLVRFVLDQELPFPALFSTSFTIVSQESLAFWELNDDGEAWSGGVYHFALFEDERPGAGLLTSPGLLAAYGSRSDPSQQRRIYRVLSELACLNTENHSAHVFHDLTADELASDIKQLASTRAPCSGCHMQFAQAAAAIEGLGYADNFAAWRSYAPPALEPSGYYAGIPYSGLAEFGHLLGSDPRVHRCQVEKLAGALFQRPFNERDTDAVALALTRFYDKNLDLKRAARQLFLTQEYAAAPLAKTPAKKLHLLDTSPTREESPDEGSPQATPTSAPSPASDASIHRTSSGVRLLRRQHWRGILAQLSPATLAIELPLDLDPGASESFTSDAYMPSGNYFHHADSVARQAATIIVNTELRAGVTASARRVFKDLPDGTGYGATTEIAHSQLRTLWHLLTSEDLTDGHQLYTNLQTLWTESSPDASEEDFRNAWRTILVAMLTDPSFLTY